MFKLKLKKTHDQSYSKKPSLTVICLHGISSSSKHFTNTLKFLEGTNSLKNVRFVAFDWLGNGKSKKSKKFEYTYDEQLEALENSIKKLKSNTPIILIGHSMGTLLAARYAFLHKKSIAKLILVSPAVFSREEIKFLTSNTENNVFLKKVGAKELNDRAFKNSMQNIVMNIGNQKTFENLTTPAALIYGDEDPYISINNLKIIAKNNPKYLSLIKTPGRHSISRDKYVKILEILEDFLHETL